MRIPKCLIPALRIAPRARREYLSMSVFEAKSDGIAPSCSRKPAAIDLNHAPSRAQSASYAPSSRIGETARSAKSAEAAAREKRSSVMGRYYKRLLYRRTVTYGPRTLKRISSPNEFRLFWPKHPCYLQA